MSILHLLLYLTINMICVLIEHNSHLNTNVFYCETIILHCEINKQMYKHLDTFHNFTHYIIPKSSFNVK